MRKIAYNLWIVLAALLFQACAPNEMELDKGRDTLTLSGTAATLILAQEMNDRDAFQFNWTSGSNEGTGAAISYTFEMGLVGNNYADGVKKELGKTTSRIVKYSHLELNDLLLSWGVPVETEVEIEVRVTARVSSESVVDHVSNVLKVKVTPYKFRIMSLYMLGDASPNGWANNKATPLLKVLGENGGFEWKGILNRGELKFITTLGTFDPSFVAADPSGEGNALAYHETGGANDYKFKISATGLYSVKLNIEALTIAIKNIDELQPYDDLWLSGSAAGSQPIKLTIDPSDRFIFTYSGRLGAGKLNIVTAASGANVATFQPLTDAASIFASPFELVPAGTASTTAWEVVAANKYTVKVDLRSKRIQASGFVPYDNIWMIGDASPGGWSWDAVTAMTQTSNKNVFEYEGLLNVGAIKFPLELKSDWGGKFIMAPTDGQSIDAPSGYIIANQPDNKWKVNTAGNYKITIDLYNETVSFTKK